MLPKPNAKPIFFCAFLESLGKFRNCHKAVLKKIIVSLAEIQLFSFGRADLPSPGRNRVKRYRLLSSTGLLDINV